MSDADDLTRIRQVQRIRVARDAYAAILRRLFATRPDSLFDERDRDQLFGEPDFHRASGDSSCPGCGLAYHMHAHHPAYDYLTVLCNGEAVKL